MKRGEVRRRAVRSLLTCAGVLLTLWACGHFWRLQLTFDGFAVGAAREGIWVAWWHGSDYPLPIDIHTLRLETASSYRLTKNGMISRPWEVDVRNLPFSLPVLFLSVSGAALWLSGWQRGRGSSRCACGYDLTANVSGRCPECGEEAPNAQSGSATAASGTTR